jgi:ElaB/YqjD/DUF883 family membrane-anchored ribosome-binding protein
MFKTRKQIEKKAKNLFEDLEQIKDSLCTITDEVKSKAASMFSDSLETARDKTSEIQHGINDFVSDRPFKFIGTALIVGVIAGFLLNQKK